MVVSSVSTGAVAQELHRSSPGSCFRLTHTALEVGELERTTCGTSFLLQIPLFSDLLGEPAAFDFLREQAGLAPDTELDRRPNVERICAITRDQRQLLGYHIKASHSRGGYVLAALGNASLAARFLDNLIFLADLGFDVFVFDYRGYNESIGNPRFSAIVDDYLHLASYLYDNKSDHEKLVFYGMSFGAVVLLRAISLRAPYDAAVIDSDPSTAHSECPSYYHPINNIPHEHSNLLFMFGSNDDVVTPDMTISLRTQLDDLGANVIELPVSHPRPKAEDVQGFEERKKALVRFLSPYVKEELRQK